MKKQQFLKIDKSHVAKNKVQKLIQQYLEALDQTLFNDFDTAKLTVTKAKDKAVSEYSGKAAIPVLKEFAPNKGITKFYIEDVIYLTIYEVKTVIK